MVFAKGAGGEKLIGSRRLEKEEKKKKKKKSKKSESLAEKGERRWMGEASNLGGWLRKVCWKNKKGWMGGEKQPNKLKANLMNQGFCGFLAPPKVPFLTPSQPQIFFLIILEQDIRGKQINQLFLNTCGESRLRRRWTAAMRGLCIEVRELWPPSRLSTASSPLLLFSLGAFFFLFLLPS